MTDKILKKAQTISDFWYVIARGHAVQVYSNDKWVDFDADNAAEIFGLLWADPNWRIKPPTPLKVWALAAGKDIIAVSSDYDEIVTKRLTEFKYARIIEFVE